MKSFCRFITEAKNVHLTHLEDLLFLEGASGIDTALVYLEDSLDMLSGSNSDTKISTKFDGSPAIICGKHPETKKFFVGTKGVFNKTPKYASKLSDIDTLYSHAPELQSIMRSAFVHLSKLPITGILQGDLLFTENSKKHVDGMIVFQPNTIVYAADADSTIGREIDRAKLGIVFHTQYTGSDLSNLSASFFPNVNGLKGNPNVWVTDAEYRTLDSKVLIPNANAILAKLEKIRGAAAKNTGIINEISKNPVLQSQLMMYSNAVVRAGQSIDTMSASGFLEWKKSRNEEFKGETGAWVFTNTKNLDLIFRIYADISNAKNAVVEHLGKVSTLKTMFADESGYRITAPEGFVAVRDGKAIKLVDRLTFSAQNFVSGAAKYGIKV